jgi:hypothetical protein
MLEQPVLRVSDRRPAPFKRVKRKPDVPGVRQRAAPGLPEGWSARLRQQARNLARAAEMLEQALAMVEEPRTEPLARAQCLRGAGLIALIAASELLVVAGWYEAAQAVAGGSRDDA